MESRIIPPAPWEEKEIPPAPWEMAETSTNPEVAEEFVQEEEVTTIDDVRELLAEIEIETQVRIAETGDVVTIQESADESLNFLEERLESYGALKTSLAKGSLPASLKKHKDKFSDFEQSEIENATAKLSGLGYGKDSALQAIDDILNGLDEQRSTLISKIEAQLGIQIASDIDFSKIEFLGFV